MRSSAASGWRSCSSRNKCHQCYKRERFFTFSTTPRRLRPASISSSSHSNAVAKTLFQPPLVRPATFSTAAQLSVDPGPQPFPRHLHLIPNAPPPVQPLLPPTLQPPLTLNRMRPPPRLGATQPSRQLVHPELRESGVALELVWALAVPVCSLSSVQFFLDCKSDAVTVPPSRW